MYGKYIINKKKEIGIFLYVLKFTKIYYKVPKYIVILYK